MQYIVLGIGSLYALFNMMTLDRGVDLAVIILNALIFVLLLVGDWETK